MKKCSLLCLSLFRPSLNGEVGGGKQQNISPIDPPATSIMSRLNCRFGVKIATPESVVSGLLMPLDATLAMIMIISGKPTPYLSEDMAYYDVVSA